MENLIRIWMTIVMFGTVGVACTSSPEWIQKIALGFYSRHPGLARLNPFLTWMKSTSYVSTLRLVGLLCIAAAVFVLWIAVKVHG